MPRKSNFEILRAKLLYDPDLLEFETIIENGEPKLVCYGPSIDRLVEKLEQEQATAKPPDSKKSGKNPRKTAL
jgi:hypothetical protein